MDSVRLDVLNAVISLVCCSAFFIYPSKPYSLYKIFHVFVLFFFCIAPAVQYRYNVHFFGTFFPESLYVRTSFLVLLILLAFNVLYVVVYARAKVTMGRRRRDVPMEYSASIGWRTELLLVAISAGVFCLMFYINGFNFTSMLFRGGEFKEDMVELQQSAGLIIGNFLKPMSMVVFLSALVAGVRHKEVLPVLFVLLLLSCPPTGMARFSVAAMYIPVCLCLVPFFRRKDVFVLVMCFSLLVIFPFLDNFRYYSAGQDIRFGMNFEQFTELHFDSYSMFMRALSSGIVTWGHQLLGVLLFWIPRSLWPAKPIGSGAFLATENGWYFTNVSMPFFGEGYINFGIVGVLVFVLVLACFCAVEDKKYWELYKNRSRDLRKIRYFILIAMLMFIMRGDLLSSVAYTCGYMASYYVVKRFVLRR